jgi:hypothetical protein
MWAAKEIAKFIDRLTGCGRRLRADDLSFFHVYAVIRFGLFTVVIVQLAVVAFFILNTTIRAGRDTIPGVSAGIAQHAVGPGFGTR